MEQRSIEVVDLVVARVGSVEATGDPTLPWRVLNVTSTPSPSRRQTQIRPKSIRIHSDAVVCIFSDGQHHHPQKGDTTRNPSDQALRLCRGGSLHWMPRR